MIATREKAQLMSASEIDRTLVRLAHEILEKTEDLKRLAFIGIRRRGVPLAQRIAKKIRDLENLDGPVGHSRHKPVSRRSFDCRGPPGSQRDGNQFSGHR